jgi:hypothetical protein
MDKCIYDFFASNLREHVFMKESHTFYEDAKHILQGHVMLWLNGQEPFSEWTTELQISLHLWIHSEAEKILGNTNLNEGGSKVPAERRTMLRESLWLAALEKLDTIL